MDYQGLEEAYSALQKEVFKLRLENDQLRHGQHWCDIIGSSWDLQQQKLQQYPDTGALTTQRVDVARTRSAQAGSAAHADAEGVNELVSRLRHYEANEKLVAGAFRQIKYELYCATVDLLGFSLHVKEGRNCLVTMAYGLNIGTAHFDFEFIYDARQHRYVDLIWSPQVEKYTSIYQYWIQENHYLPGFLASVMLEEYSKRGPPRPGRVKQLLDPIGPCDQATRSSIWDDISAPKDK